MYTCTLTTNAHRCASYTSQSDSGRHACPPVCRRAPVAGPWSPPPWPPGLPASPPAHASGQPPPPPPAAAAPRGPPAESGGCRSPSPVPHGDAAVVRAGEGGGGGREGGREGGKKAEV